MLRVAVRIERRSRLRSEYNFERPHEALGQNVPASRYRPSPRAMPEHLPQIAYDDGEIVRTVGSTRDYISFRGRLWKVPQAFRGERLAIRPLSLDGRTASSSPPTRSQAST